VLANYLARRQGSLDRPWPILGACLLVAPPALLVLLHGPSNLVFGGIVAGMLFLPGPACATVYRRRRDGSSSIV
jgi:cell division protein FtsW (lipid II flippase)